MNKTLSVYLLILMTHAEGIYPFYRQELRLKVASLSSPSQFVTQAV